MVVRLRPWLLAAGLMLLLTAASGLRVQGRVPAEARANLLGSLAHYEVAHLNSEHLQLLRDLHQHRMQAQARATAHKQRPTPGAHPNSSEFRLQAFGLELTVSLNKNTKVNAHAHSRTSTDTDENQHTLTRDSDSDPTRREVSLTPRSRPQLFGAGYTQTREARDASGRPTVESRQGITAAENCFYHGHATARAEDGAEDVVTGWSAFNTCHGGFSGVLHVGSIRYGVEIAHRHMPDDALAHHRQTLQARGHPEASDASLHIVYRLADYEPEGVQQGEHWCSAGDVMLAGLPHHGEHALDHGHSGFSHSGARRLLQETREVELIVVNDVAKFNDDGDDTEIKSADITNIVAALYDAEPLGGEAISVVLVAQHTFVTSDPWPAAYDCDDCGEGEVGVDALLRDFHEWRSTPGALPSHDNGQLFSGLDFQGNVLGYAGVGTMCIHQQSGGIDQTRPTHANNFLAAVVAHEMGHNFGMRHDSSGNDCAQSGFIMNALVGPNPPTEFSTCSEVYFNGWRSNSYSSCIDDTTTERWGDPVCGNSFIESGEECDCGQADCSEVDPCCDGATCRLVQGAQCSSLLGCCTDQCELIMLSEGLVCRPAIGECDLPEMCDGFTAACPDDAVMGTGTPCKDDFGEGYCYGNTCSTHDRACNFIGSGYTGSPYTGCEGASSRDNFCGRLLCQSTTSGTDQCSVFPAQGTDGTMAVPDGVPCSGDSVAHQCHNGACVSSDELVPYLIWVTSLWSSCSECGEQQTRTTKCYRRRQDFSVTRELDAVCSPASKPDLARACQNSTLQCDQQDDNDLSRTARDLAERYNALDKAEKLRSLIPRIYGYPDDFDAHDDDYAMGIKLLALYGLVATLASIVAYAIFKYRRNKCNKCGGQEPDEMGYTAAQRCVPYSVLLFVSILIVAFTCVGLFFNEELMSGVRDPDVGAAVLMIEVLAETQQTAELVQVPLMKVRDDAPALVEDILPDLNSAALLTEDRPVDGDFVFQSRLETTAAIVRGRQSLSVPGVGTAATVAVSCVECEGIAEEADSALMTLLNSSIGLQLGVMHDAASVSHDAFADLQLRLAAGELDPSILRVSLVINKTRDSQADVAYWSDSAITLDYYRRPFTMVLLVAPLLGMLLVFPFAAICRKSSQSLFGCNYHLGFSVMVLVWLLFAFHLPLACLGGDSCKYLNEGEQDMAGKLNISVEAAAIMQSCLDQTSMVEALNLTDLMRFAAVVDLPELPNMSVVFSGTDDAMVELVDAMEAVELENMWDYDWTTVDDKLFELNAIAASQADTDAPYDRETISGFTAAGYSNAGSPSPRSQALALRDEILTHIGMELRLTAEYGTMGDAVSGVRSYSSALESNAVVAREKFEDVQSNGELWPVINAGQTINEFAQCGNLGQLYINFKDSWCNVITTAFSFLMLVFFVIGLLSIITVYLSIVLRKRMPENNHHENVIKRLDSQSSLGIAKDTWNSKNHSPASGGSRTSPSYSGGSPNSITAAQQMHHDKLRQQQLRHKQLRKQQAHYERRRQQRQQEEQQRQQQLEQQQPQQQHEQQQRHQQEKRQRQQQAQQQQYAREPAEYSVQEGPPPPRRRRSREEARGDSLGSLFQAEIVPASHGSTQLRQSQSHRSMQEPLRRSSTHHGPDHHPSQPPPQRAIANNDNCGPDRSQHRQNNQRQSHVDAGHSPRHSAHSSHERAHHSYDSTPEHSPSRLRRGQSGRTSRHVRPSHSEMELRPSQRQRNHRTPSDEAEADLESTRSSRSRSSRHSNHSDGHPPRRLSGSRSSSRSPRRQRHSNSRHQHEDIAQLPGSLEPERHAPRERRQSSRQHGQPSWEQPTRPRRDNRDHREGRDIVRVHSFRNNGSTSSRYASRASNQRAVIDADGYEHVPDSRRNVY